MQSVTLVGIDLGKHSFHLHGQDQLGRAVFRKKVDPASFSRTATHAAIMRLAQPGKALKIVEDFNRIVD